MVSPQTAARDIAQAGALRMVSTIAWMTPSLALVQVLASSRSYRQPAVAVAIWLLVLAAARWLLPRLRAGGLSGRQSAAAIAIAVGAVALVALVRRPSAAPGSVDLALLGTVWLLVLVALSRPGRVWIPAAAAVFAVHSALLIHAQGLNRLSLSELAVGGYIVAGVLIAFVALRPTLAVHAALAARRSSLAAKSAAERAAAAAIGQERRSRLDLLEQEALPLLRGIADGTLDATAAAVRDDCARHAAVLRRSLNGRPAGTGTLPDALEPSLRTARERGMTVDVQLIGDPGTPPPELARAVQRTVGAVLASLVPQEVTLTVIADGDDPGTGNAASDHRSGAYPGEVRAGGDVELFLTFDIPPQRPPDLGDYAFEVPATAGWRASVSALTADAGGGYLEVGWRKESAA